MPAEVATFVFEVINLVVLAAALGWVFTNPMRTWLDAELGARAESKRALDERAAEVELSQKELAARLEALGRETELAREHVRDEAKAQAAAILEAARARAEEERARAIAEIEERRRGESEALSAELGKMAEKLVLDLFALGSGAETDLAFARAARGKLSKLSERSKGELLVECAHAASEELRLLLRSSLGPALDRAELRIVPELVAGIRVVSDAGLVDASARGLARYAETTIRSGEASGDG